MLRLLKNSAKPFIKQCNFYLPRDGGMAIIASTYNHGGLFAEKASGAESCTTANLEALGQLIRRKLSECEYQEDFNYSQTKRSDWPAYKASGLKAIKAFEKGFVWYSIRGVNDANITLQIVSPALLDGIELHSAISASASTDELGRTAIKLHEFFLKTERAT